jgi:hypothetical protein
MFLKSIKKNTKMKKLSIFLTTIVLLLSLGSCGVNGALILNHNQNATQVHLTNNNYKVLEKVSGSADVNYVMLFGGMNRRQLYKSAYDKMVDSANLLGSSRALINIVTEEHLGGVPPFFYRRTITVSANVIEFVK